MMTEKQWIEVGGIADYEFVDFGGNNHNIKGWTKRVKELGYLTDEEEAELGGWEDVFWNA